MMLGLPLRESGVGKSTCGLVSASAAGSRRVGGRGSASAHSSRLHGAHACAGRIGYTCATLDVPLDHAHPGRGKLHLHVGMGDNVARAARCAVRPFRRAGQPGLPILDRYVKDALGRAAPVPHRRDRPARNGCRRARLQGDAAPDGELGPHSAEGLRRPGVRPQARNTTSVLRHRRRRRRHGGFRQALGVDKWSLDGISYGTYVGERYGLAHPSHVSKLVLDSVVPQVGEIDLGVAEFAAVRRVLHSVCGPGCMSDLATVVRRDHLGPQLLDALTFDSIADPTYRKYWNVPAALHAASRGNRKQLDRFLAAALHYQRCPLRCSTRAFTRARSAPTGGIPGAPRPRRSPAAPRSSEPQSRGSRRRSSIRSAARRPSGNGFVRQCLPWAPTGPTPSAAREAPRADAARQRQP